MRKESGTSPSSNKGIKMMETKMALNHVDLSDEEPSKTKDSTTKCIMANGRTLVNGLEEEEKERTSVEKAMNESAPSSSSSLVATKTTSHPVKGGENREKGRNFPSSSKQGCSSFIESSRELVQSLFYPSSSSSSSSTSHSYSSSLSKIQGEGKGDRVNGHQQEEESKIDVSKGKSLDLGHQYNNNYHEHKPVDMDREGGKVRNEKYSDNSKGKEVKSYRNNHHLANNKKYLPRKLLVTKKNKNHVFFSPINPHVTSHPPISSFHLPPLPTRASNLSNQVNYHPRRQHQNQYRENLDGQATSCKPILPLLHFKDDEPTTTVEIVPYSHPGHQEGSIATVPVDSGTCKNCYKIKSIKGSPSSQQQPLNVTISQSNSSPPGNPSPPESLDSCSLFCSTTSSTFSSPSSSPTSSSPSASSNNSTSNSCPQFQKQGILKTNKSSCNKLVTIHDHLEKLTITGLNDKSGVMIPLSTNSSPSDTSLLSSSSASCCTSSSLNQGSQSRTGSSSSSSKKVHFADMCYERNYDLDGNEKEKKGEKKNDKVGSNPTSHRSLSSDHSSSLVIISEKTFPSPKRCTFKEISV